MDLLDWYDILLWKKDGKYYVSTDYPMMVFKITKAGYELLGDLTNWEHEVQNIRCQLGLRNITNYELSRLLDDKECEPIGRLLNIRKGKK
jgi:hypothetical protein